jgi:hypothetical protein
MYRKSFRRCESRQTSERLYSRFFSVLYVLKIHGLVYRLIVLILFSLGMVNASWRPLYELAIAETDPAKKGACLKAAEEAIHARAIALEGQISRDDLLAMRDASSNLRTLKQEWKQSSVRNLGNHK